MADYHSQGQSSSAVQRSQWRFVELLLIELLGIFLLRRQPNNEVSRVCRPLIHGGSARRHWDRDKLIVVTCLLEGVENVLPELRGELIEHDGGVAKEVFVVTVVDNDEVATDRCNLREDQNFRHTIGLDLDHWWWWWLQGSGESAALGRHDSDET